MKKQIQILMTLIVLLLGVGAVFGQRATRVKFPRGAKVVVVSDRLNGYKGEKTFLVRVRSGQTLSTEQIGVNYITVGVESPSGEEVNDADASCNNRKRVTPTEAGDYKIIVAECQKADPWRGNFRLRITVR